jgi:alanine racemase
MYDLILKGGLVVDGTRSAPYIANVCVADGKIARITSEEAEAKEVLDVTGLDVKVGDTVTIFGEEPSIAELADILGTIPYEILTSVPRRIERIIIADEQ